MKNLFALIAVLGMLTIGASKLMAQDATAATPADTTVAATDETVMEEGGVTPEGMPTTPTSIDEEEIESTSMHAAIKQKFIEGGAFWMAPIALCLIFGLAVAIERVIYLNLADINTSKFLKKFEDTLNNGGIEAAKDFCRNTQPDPRMV